MGEFSIGDAINEFLNKSRIKGGIQALQIEDVWEQIMGKTISAKLIARAVLVSSLLPPKGHFFLLIAGLPKGHVSADSSVA